MSVEPRRPPALEAAPVRLSWRLVIGSVLLIVLISGGLTARWLEDRLQLARHELAQATSALTTVPPDPAVLPTVRGHLATARTELDAVRPLISPLVEVARSLADVPLIGRPAQQAAALWSFGDAGLSLADELVSAAELVVASRAQGTAPGLIAATPTLDEKLRRAEQQLERAETARHVLGTPPQQLDHLTPLLVQWDQRAPQLRQAIGTALPLIKPLSIALGAERPMTYLVLAQTNDELRASGGFITSIGTVRLERGRIAAMAFQKVYAAEGIDVAGPKDTSGGRYVVPPASFQRYMGIGQWHLRDANWWADFPATARQAARFWEQLHQEHVDGVIAFDETGLEAVLEIVGPVRLSNGTVVDARNVKAITLGEVFQGKQAAGWYQAQSAFSQSLASALVAAAEQLPAERLGTVVHQLRIAAQRRQIQIASFDSDVAAVLHDAGLDGALQGQHDDFLYLVESNVGYSKLSQFIRQDLTYSVELAADGRPVRAALVIDVANTYQKRLRHPGYPPGYYNGGLWNATKRRLVTSEGYYGGFTRVLLPRESRVLEAVGFDTNATVGTEGGRVVVGGYQGLGIDAQRQIHLAWLPGGEPRTPGQYRLVVQRQPGAPAHALAIRVTLPAGSSPDNIAPPAESIEGGVVTWRTTLDQDRVFLITLDRSLAAMSATR